MVLVSASLIALLLGQQPASPAKSLLGRKWGKASSPSSSSLQFLSQDRIGPISWPSASTVRVLSLHSRLGRGLLKLTTVYLATQSRYWPMGSYSDIRAGLSFYCHHSRIIFTSVIYLCGARSVLSRFVDACALSGITRSSVLCRRATCA